MYEAVYTHLLVSAPSLCLTTLTSVIVHWCSLYMSLYWVGRRWSSFYLLPSERCRSARLNLVWTEGVLCSELDEVNRSVSQSMLKSQGQASLLSASDGSFLYDAELYKSIYLYRYLYLLFTLFCRPWILIKMWTHWPPVAYVLYLAGRSFLWNNLSVDRNDYHDWRPCWSDVVMLAVFESTLRLHCL